MEPTYRHTQFGRTTLVASGLALAVAAARSLQVSNVGPLVVVGFFACALALFSTLTVMVRDQSFEVSFWPGLVSRRIPLRRIQGVTVVRNSWLYGWGIRLTPHGWLWNVSGLGAVELRLDDGQRFRVGSDEPEALADVLLHAERKP